MSEAANRRLLRLPEVKEKVGLSRTAHPGCGERACGEPLIAHQRQQQPAW